VLGHKPATVTTNGKQYKRPHSKDVAALKKHMETLQEILLAKAGGWKARTPEPLIQVYEDETGQKRPNVYRHAPLAISALKSNFTQVPLAVLRLPANDVPLALGVANVVRQHATAMLRGSGSHRAPLRQLLEAIGEDCEAGSRRDGRSYWADKAADLARVCSAGGLGLVSVDGDGPGAKVTLALDYTLAEAYRPLAMRSSERGEQAMVAEAEAAVRKLMPSPPRKRRSRKATA
jgi:hypothetical protein